MYIAISLSLRLGVVGYKDEVENSTRMNNGKTHGPETIFTEAYYI